MMADEHQQWDGDVPPAGLAEALGERSLGNPATIDALVGGFVTRVGDLAGQCWGGQLSSEALEAQIKDACTKLGRAFSGLDERFVATSWNTATHGGLQAKARALLASSRENFGVDCNFDPALPVAGLFYLLAQHTLSAYKAAARGVESHSLPETIRFISTTLLGVPEGPR